MTARSGPRFTAAAHPATGDPVDLPVAEVRAEEPFLDASRVPDAVVRVPDPSGVYGAMLSVGREVTVRREGERLMLGLVVAPVRRAGAGGGDAVARLADKGYHLLRRQACLGYVYDEDGATETARDAVRVNPWRWFVLRKPGTTLDARGLEQAVDGVRRDEAVRCLLGTRHVWQLDFADNRWLLPSQIAAASNKVQAYQDDGDARPFLQRVRRAAGGYEAGAAVETIALLNGPANVVAMGDVTKVEVLLVGELDGESDPTVRVSRNADESPRAWETLTLKRDLNYRGTGLHAWTGERAFTGSTTQKNRVALELTVPGTAGSAGTTKIQYARATATKAGETGLTEGTIDRYPDAALTNALPVSQEMEKNIANAPSALGTPLKLHGGGFTKALQWFKWSGPKDTEIRAATFRIRKVGAPTGTITVRASDARGSGGATATLDAAADVTASWQDKRVAFTAPYQGAPAGGGVGADRNVGLEYAGGDASNYLEWAVASNDEIPDNNREFWDGSFWTAAAQDHVVVVHGVERDGAWIDDDLEGLTKLDALERVRRGTEANAAASPDPHWDAWIDPALALHFRERRGAAVEARPLGLEDGTLSVLETESLADAVAYQTVAVGGGRGDGELLLVDRSEWTAGGLYDAANDPAGATRAYGDVPRVLVHREPGVTSLDELRLRARGAHRARRAPREFLRVRLPPEHPRYLRVGDEARVVAPRLRVNALRRVHAVARAWTADGGEEVDLELGERLRAPEEVLRAERLRVDQGAAGALRVPRGGAVAGPGVRFDKDRYGRFSFAVPEGLAVDRVLLHMRTLPWQTDVRDTANADGPGTHKHAVVLGIRQFDGDAGDGTGDPKYAQGIQWAVDPSLSAAGVPNDWANDKHPVHWGAEAASEEVLVDVTGYLATLANGRVAPGVHNVFFLGGTTAANAQGLGVVGVTPVLRFREVEA